MRSAVSVREGQGVVLLCGTPPRAGGKGASGLVGLGEIPGNAREQNESEVWVLKELQGERNQKRRRGREAFKRIYFYLEMPFWFLVISVHLMCLIFMVFPVINGVSSGVRFCPIARLLSLDESSFPCEQTIAERRLLSLTELVSAWVLAIKTFCGVVE